MDKIYDNLLRSFRLFRFNSKKGSEFIKDTLIFKLYLKQLANVLIDSSICAYYPLNVTELEILRWHSGVYSNGEYVATHEYLSAIGATNYDFCRALETIENLFSPYKTNGKFSIGKDRFDNDIVLCNGKELPYATKDDINGTTYIGALNCNSKVHGKLINNDILTVDSYLNCNYHKYIVGDSEASIEKVHELGLKFYDEYPLQDDYWIHEIGLKKSLVNKLREAGIFKVSDFGGQTINFLKEKCAIDDKRIIEIQGALNNLGFCFDDLSRDDSIKKLLEFIDKADSGSDDFETRYKSLCLEIRNMACKKYNVYKKKKKI